MKCERADVLNNFLKSEKFKEITGLTGDEIKNISFSSDSPDVFIESLKKLVLTYCIEGNEMQVLRAVNTRINS